ncbi:MAG: thiamine-phosphate kinase [Candidatus Njordarchaeia archaeon]
MKLSDIGEREFLKKILPMLDEHELHTDDDATAYRINNKYIVINVDTLVQSTDILPGMTPEQIGNKIVVMTLSDIITKGAKPSFFLVSLNARGDAEVGYLVSIEKGIKNACRQYNVLYFGGDLNESKELVITGVGIGFATHVIPRRGAKVGDSLWTTGYFGLTGAAFHFLFYNGKPTENMDSILKSVYNPSLRIFDGTIFSSLASASMDSSDGLAATLNTLAEINNIKIVLDNIPIPQDVIEYAHRNKIDPLELAFYAGEEYEIIFTSHLDNKTVLEKFEKAGLPKPIRIGRVEAGSGVVYKGKNVEFRGWEHFKSEF